MVNMSKHQRYVQSKQGPVRLNRSYDSDFNEIRNPWKALAAAIIFQAAVDCENWTPDVESPCYTTGGGHAGIKYQRKAKLAEFINSDWLDLLLCWQHEITPEAVCEELVRRLTS